MNDREKKASELLAGVDGAVLGPGDARYAAAIAGFNTAVVHRPPVVVVAASSGDVLQALRVAREQGLPVSVQSTGHGAARPITEGVLVCTQGWDDVTVDPGTRTARIGAGARWGAVIAAAAPHGLAPNAGSSPGVGVVGYLLGGGLGPLARSHGYGSDYLVGLSVVTGAGEALEVSAEQHPDLFWALRGGGAPPAIVTEVTLRLVAIPQLYAGALLFEEVHLEAVMGRWVDFTAQAPAAVTTSLAIVDFPPLDVLPPPLRGRRLAALRFAYPGPSDEGARLAAPLREAAPVYLDGLGPLPLAEVARIHSDPTDPGPTWVRGVLLSKLDRSGAAVLLDQVGAGRGAPFRVVELRHVGGDSTRADVAGGSAVGGRGADFTLTLISRDASRFETTLPAAADRLLAALHPWVAPETNINFTPEPLAAAPLVAPWSPSTAARLQEVRRRYDPDGVLTRNVA